MNAPPPPLSLLSTSTKPSLTLQSILASYTPEQLLELQRQYQEEERQREKNNPQGGRRTKRRGTKRRHTKRHRKNRSRRH